MDCNLTVASPSAKKDEELKTLLFPEEFLYKAQEILIQAGKDPEEIILTEPREVIHVWCVCPHCKGYGQHLVTSPVEMLFPVDSSDSQGDIYTKEAVAEMTETFIKMYGATVENGIATFAAVCQPCNGAGVIILRVHWLVVQYLKEFGKHLFTRNM